MLYCKKGTGELMSLSEMQIAQLADEIKACLKKWLLEEDVSIFYNNIRSYSNRLSEYSYEWINEKEKPENYTKYVAKDHILTMIFTGPLNDLINNEGFDPIEVDGFDQVMISYIIKAVNLKSCVQSYINELRLDLDENRLSHGDEELLPSDFKSYEEYLLHRDEIENEIEEEAIESILDECIWFITEFARKEFNSIFDKYGIWYDFGYNWSITCFYNSENPEYID